MSELDGRRRTGISADDRTTLEIVIGDNLMSREICGRRIAGAATGRVLPLVYVYSAVEALRVDPPAKKTGAPLCVSISGTIEVTMPPPRLTIALTMFLLPAAQPQPQVAMCRPNWWAPGANRHT